MENNIIKMNKSLKEDTNIIYYSHQNFKWEFKKYFKNIFYIIILSLNLNNGK